MSGRACNVRVSGKSRDPVPHVSKWATSDMSEPEPLLLASLEKLERDIGYFTRVPFEGCMRRREFITVLGGAAAAWPLAASGQQSSTRVGFLGSSSLQAYTFRLRAFAKG